MGWSASERNLITGKSDQGVNPLLLEVGLLLRENGCTLWCGGAQAKALGWFPKKWSKGVRILRPQLNSREMVDGDGKSQLDGEGQTLVSAGVSYKPVVGSMPATSLVATMFQLLSCISAWPLS